MLAKKSCYFRTLNYMFFVRSYFFYCFFKFFFYEFLYILFWFYYFYNFHGFTSKSLGSNGLILYSIDFGFSPKFSFSNCWKRLSILFSSNLLGFLTNCSRIWSNFWFSFSNISFKFGCSTLIFYISFLQNLSLLTNCSFI